MGTQLRDAALAYAALGWHVFPLGVRSKKPLIPKTEGGRGLLDATTKAEQITEWWSRWPQANVGISCGPSGLAVIDLDTDKGGITAWKKLSEALDVPLRAAVMAKTGGGGVHLLYKNDSEVHNSAQRLGPGIDVRGIGGYIVVPPSVHPTGNKYEWFPGRSPSDRGPTPLPSLLAAKLIAPLADDHEAVDVDMIPEGRRDNTLTSLAGSMRRRGMAEEEILAALRVTNTNRCIPPLPDEILRRKVASVCRYRPHVEAHFTDLGNAKLLVAQHGENLRFCADWKRWLVWDGTSWSTDNTGEVMRLAKESILSLYYQAAQLPGKADRERATKHAIRSEARSRLEAMTSLAESEAEVSASPGDFDTDLWVLNVGNGLIDLRTGELRPHRREDMCTKVAPVFYDKEAECPHWMEFLDLVFQGNEKLIAYVQQMAGYALTGSTREQVFFILYGSGANGKSTFTETLAGILGDYAQQVPTTTLMVQRPGSGDQPRADLARLNGIRFATAIETEAGRRLAEALVKQMTGGDRIAARFPYGRYFEFRPTHKVFLATNHKPTIRGTDHAIWRRIHLTPFLTTITEPIPNYAERFLKAEWSGILRWAVEGCLAWQQAQHLEKPPAVAEATEQFRAEMNPVVQFVEDCCVVDPTRDVRGLELWIEYKNWCTSNRERSVSRNEFSGALAQAGYERFRRNDGTWHRGLSLGHVSDEDLVRLGKTI